MLLLSIRHKEVHTTIQTYKRNIANKSDNIDLFLCEHLGVVEWYYVYFLVGCTSTNATLAKLQEFCTGFDGLAETNEIELSEAEELASRIQRHLANAEHSGSGPRIEPDDTLIFDEEFPDLATRIQSNPLLNMEFLTQDERLKLNQSIDIVDGSQKSISD